MNEEIEPGEPYICNVQWSNRKYKTYYKRFNDESHFNNWYDFINSRGGKVIGVTKEPTVDEK